MTEQKQKQDQSQLRRALHMKDQLRVNQAIKQIADKFGPKLVKSRIEALAKTPKYKKYRNKEMLLGAGTLGGTAGLTGLTLKGKKGLLAGLAGAGAGAAYGYGRARKGLRRKSEKDINKQVDSLLKREANKTFRAHRYLAKPGVQVARIKRPWGNEAYKG